MTVAVALVLAAVAAVLAVTVIADRTRQPASVLLVLAGVAYALLPGPNLTLEPDLIVVVVIPPLLYASALNSSFLAMRANAQVIGSLSVGLVLVTAVAVGVVLHAAVPAVPLAVGIALGAAVSPPDPVAALGIGRRAGLPPRLITLVEGEGLLNDATALTTLQVAVAAAVGGSFSVPGALARLLLSAAGGVVVGLAVAVALGFVRSHLNDPLVENSISLATPFAAYLAGDEAHVSGVLAVVVAGLWFGHHSPGLQSSQSRLQTRAVWRLVEFLLEGFVFLLIGQQLPGVVRGLKVYPAGTVAAAVVVTLGLVLALRPVWLVVTTRLPARLHTRLGGAASHDDPPLSRKEVLALTWSGTRGVITLAAVFSLPLTVHGGGRFPDRDLILFCAYVVVLVTLVGQGLTFAPLLRRLHLGSADVDQALVRNEARVAAVQASLDRLQQLLDDEPQPEEIVAPLRRAAQIRQRRYAERVEQLAEIDDGVLPVDGPYFISVRLRRAMIDAEREELLEWRDCGRLPDTSLRVLQRELDHEEGLLPPG